MGFNVFISYSTRDLNRATNVKEMLEETGSKVFLAEYSVSPSEDLSSGIKTAIENCDLFILLWSTHARDSEWVPQEIGIAKANDKPIMPVFLHKHLELPGFLKGLKYLPLHKNPEENLKWLQEHVYEKSEAKGRRNGLVWLGVGAALMWLLGRQGEGEVA